MVSCKSVKRRELQSWGFLTVIFALESKVHSVVTLTHIGDQSSEHDDANYMCCNAHGCVAMPKARVATLKLWLDVVFDRWNNF